jgi:hypothetical protein
MLAFPFSSASMEIISRGNFKAFYAAFLDFKDDPVRVHTDYGTRVINGETYYGVGHLGSVGTLSEEMNADSPLSVELKLSGLDPEFIENTVIKGCRGRQGKLMICFVDDVNGGIVADTLFSGRMDAAKVSAGAGDNNSITVPIVDRMAEWSRKGTKRWTDESHRARHNNDRFLAYIAQLTNKQIFWGSKADGVGFKYE